MHFSWKKDILLVACCLGHTVQIKGQVQVLALNQTDCPEGNDFAFLQFHSFPPSVRTRSGHSGRCGGFCAQCACRVNTALLSILQYCPFLILPLFMEKETLFSFKLYSYSYILNFTVLHNVLIKGYQDIAFFINRI